MPTTSDRHHEVIVVGARAAGASTAMLLARMGHDVALVDKAQFPSDTLSTHALSHHGGVVQLNRWGLLEDVLATGTPAVRQVTFGTADGQLTRTVKLTAGVDVLLAPRRLWLDALLLDAARRGRRRAVPADDGARADPGYRRPGDRSRDHPSDGRGASD